MVKIGSTWKGRNYNKLQRAKEEAIKLGLNQPTILEVGPGGLVNFLFAYFPTGKRKDWTSKDTLKWKILRIVEGILRKTDLFDLESSESEEVVYTFKDLQPKRIYVVDCEPKIIEAAGRVIARNGFSKSFEYGLIDVASQKLPYNADIVIAYRVAQRTSNPSKALETIANSVNIGGLLSLDRDVELTGFHRIDRGLYVRRD